MTAVSKRIIARAAAGARGATLLVAVAGIGCTHPEAGQADASRSAPTAAAAPEASKEPAASHARARPNVLLPNVLLIVIDTLRRDHLSLYHYEKPTSPRLAKLAESALVFERATAASSWTEPSTASLLCGLYPPRHGAHEYARIPAAVTMLAEVLHDAGYRTGAVSGNPNASPLFGFDQGFDSFDFKGGDEAREYPDVSELIERARAFIHDATRGHDATTPPPFFCYLHVMNVHGPYRAPPQYRERFLEKPFTEFPFQNELWKEILRKGRIERRKDVTPEHLRDLTARYDGAIAYTDEQLGAFIEERLAAGGAKDDLIVVTADHGEELFDHGGFGHGFSLHRELVDVPLLLRLPGGIHGGSRIAEPVSLVDVAPTLLDHLDLLREQPDGRFGDGASLLPLLRGERVERPGPIVAQLLREKQGKAFLVQQWPLRIVLTEHDYAGRRDVLELFDEAADPREEHDLAAGDASRSESLRRTLLARRAQLDAAAIQATREELDEATRRRMDALGYGNEDKTGGR